MESRRALLATQEISLIRQESSLREREALVLGRREMPGREDGGVVRKDQEKEQQSAVESEDGESRDKSSEKN